MRFCMNSWDSPSSKAISVEDTETLVVWMEQGKFEPIRYLGIPEDKNRISLVQKNFRFIYKKFQLN